MKVDIKIDGLEDIYRRLGKFKGGVQRNIMRVAVGKGLIPINRAAKVLCPKETGTLRRSIGKKVVAYKSFVVWGGVGPRKGMQYWTVDPDAKSGFRKPTKYAHLIEFGSRHAGAKSFLRPALDEQRGAAYQATKDSALKGVERETLKLARE